MLWLLRFGSNFYTTGFLLQVQLPDLLVATDGHSQCVHKRSRDRSIRSSGTYLWIPSHLESMS